MKKIKIPNKYLVLILLIILLAVINVIICCVFDFDKRLSGKYKGYIEANLGGREVFVEVADSVEERTNGLSGRQALCENCGMYFVFYKKDYYSFWMKDMLFSIDIIWLDDMRVVGVERNVTHTKPYEHYSPPGTINGVIEMPAGWSAKNKLKIGDSFEF